MNHNALIFNRIVSLRSKFYDTQAQFVECLNKYLEEQTNISEDGRVEKTTQKITTNTYTTIEKNLSTKSSNLIAIINYFSDIHDINPAWILSYDNFLVSQFNIQNNELTKVNEYKKAIKEIKSIIAKLNNSNTH